MREFPDYHIEIECSQLTKTGESACGDYFEVKRIVNEKRCLAVLSDGLGSGIKANILASMTSTMALKFFSEEMDLSHAARIIMDTLPVCEERKISYSTFTAVDILFSGRTRIIEMDNPSFVHIRKGQVVKHEQKVIQSNNWPNRSMIYTEFDLVPEDRIIFFSDGVTQAGIGTQRWKFGWGGKNCAQFINNVIKVTPDISARKLASAVAKHAATLNPEGKCIDDISCAAVYFRKPRKMLLASGPPFHQDTDSSFARLVDGFRGRKAVCGGTTATILGRELNRRIKTDLKTISDRLPPLSEMDGVDLITEGILTLTEIAKYLENGMGNTDSEVVRKLTAMLMDSDIITFLVGTRVNEAHQDPNLPVDLEIRRNIIKRIMKALEEKYHKDVFHKYV